MTTNNLHKYMKYSTFLKFEYANEFEKTMIEEDEEHRIAINNRIRYHFMT